MHLFLVTSGVFLFINTFENIIHFTIGRNIHAKDKLEPLKFEMPTKYDFIKILIVMIVFATLQGVLTCYMQDCFKTK